MTIMMQGEAHKIAQTWRLLRARIVKHVSGPLNTRATNVAIEELIISTERIVLD